MTVHVLAPFEQCLFPCMTLVILKKQKQSNEQTNQKKANIKQQPNHPPHLKNFICDIACVKFEF